MGFGYAPYVPVAKRRAQAKKKMEKLRKKGQVITPIEPMGRKIASSFWGRGWCDHIELFSDFDNRLPRGRTYVRNGSVCHLSISKNRIDAIVSGSELYNVSISVKQITDEKWEKIKRACAGQIGSLLDLLSGTLSNGVMEVVSDEKSGLFPLLNEMSLTCNCLDWAEMCKHVAATLYGVGHLLDADPNSLFILRGVNSEEFIDASHTIKDTLIQNIDSVIDDNDVSELFGISFDDYNNTDETPKENNALSKKKEFSKRAEENKPVKKLPRYFTGNTLIKCRQKLMLTKKSMSNRIGIGVSTLYRYEKLGRKKLPINDPKKLKVIEALYLEIQ